MQDLNAASVEEHKSLIASAEAKLKGHESAAADAGEKLETAKDRLQRLQRGESVSGGLGKKFDVVAAMKAAGITPGELRRMRLYGSLTKTEFESLLEPTRMKRRLEAADKAFDREARRIIRARRELIRNQGSLRGRKRADPSLTFLSPTIALEIAP